MLDGRCDLPNRGRWLGKAGEWNKKKAILRSPIKPNFSQPSYPSYHCTQRSEDLLLTGREGEKIK